MPTTELGRIEIVDDHMKVLALSFSFPDDASVELALFGMVISSTYAYKLKDQAIDILRKGIGRPAGRPSGEVEQLRIRR